VASCFFCPELNTSSGVASSKFWEGPNLLTLSEQQYLVWDTASQSTKRQSMLEIFRGMTPLAPGYPMNTR